MATNAHCSLPKWALEEPSDKVKASIADEFKQDVSSNLLLMVLFLFVITDHADAFLRYDDHTHETQHAFL